MKKMIAIFLAALLICGACFAASTESEDQALVLMEGVVTEITDDGCLIENEDLGEVMVLISEETLVETSGDIAPGDYLYIDYNGMMTRSLPPQITASTVRMHRLQGGIIELIPEENAALVSTETHGEVLVTLPEGWTDAHPDAEALTVYFNGAMTMSLPPQVNAGCVIPGYALQGVVTEMTDAYLMLGEGAQAVQVNVVPELIPETMKTGDVIRVIYNGMMTRSIPAQINADSIIQISR